MTGMAFTMAKGFYEDLFATTINEGTPGLLATLAQKLGDDTVPGGSWGLLGSPQAAAVMARWGNASPAVAGMAGHFVDDWFATHVDASGAKVTPTQVRHDQGVAPYRRLTTSGWWMGWRGDAEQIVRVGLRRVLYASAGVPWGTPASGFTAAMDAPRWPVDFRWVCGGHRFEFWLEWGPPTTVRGRGRSRIQATLLTPGAATAPLAEDWRKMPSPSDVQAADPGAGFPAPASGTPIGSGSRTMAVVGHVRNTADWKWSSAFTGTGNWPTLPPLVPGGPKLPLHVRYGSVGMPGESPIDVVTVEPGPMENGVL